MGYGYLGCYFAYGFRLKDKAHDRCEKDMDETDGGSLQSWKKNKNILIKIFGFDESGNEPSSFMCWQKVFIGGEVWRTEYNLVEDLVEDEITPAALSEVEAAYDAEAVKAFCKQYDIEYNDPKWKMLYCLGQCIY